MYKIRLKYFVKINFWEKINTILFMRNAASSEKKKKIDVYNIMIVNYGPNN